MPLPRSLYKSALKRRMAREARDFSQVDVRRALDASPLGRLIDIPMDGKYWCFTKELVLDMCRRDKTSTKPYLKTRRDCDKYAAKLWANLRWDYCTDEHVVNSIVLVVDYSGGHAYCCAVVFDPDTGELEVVVIEPQSDRVVNAGSGAYLGERGYCLF